MLKALKKGIKRLGSTNKLQDHAIDAGEVAAPQAGAAAPPQQVEPPVPQPAGPRPASGLPPRPPIAQAVHAAPDAAPEAAAPLQPAGTAAATPLPWAADDAAAAAVAAGAGISPRPAAAPPMVDYEQAVDYELVVGPLELDGAEPEAAGAGDHLAPAEHEQQGVGAAAGPLPQQQQQEGGMGQHVVCYGAGAGASGAGSSAEEEAAAAAALQAEAEGGGSGSGGGGTAADAAAEGAAAGVGISEALATMMYLTEDAEGGEDCVSVVSDALSDDEFPDDISELSRALEALEGEALGSSPGAPSAGSPAGLDDQLAERLGISPDASHPTAYAQQMAKLYNNLGLKMMERRKHEEALGLLRKAEALVDNAAVWQGAAAQAKRRRMQAITYNNLGCLLKRRNMAQMALQYLQKALALEEAGGPVQNSSSTHLNICAAYSVLRRPKEALSHAEAAIILLQRHLWPHSLAFQEGLSSVVRQLAVPGASRQLLGSANVLAMAYHNAAVEHEKLGRLREALVSFTRAYLISSKCLGAKAQMTTSLSRALKAFQQRQARYLPTGAAHAARKAPSLASGRSAAAASQSKRGHSRGSSKSVASSKSGSNLSAKALTAAATGSKATLPLDKGRTTGAASSGVAVRAPSASRLASQLQQHQQQG